ncbi:hypothetical protein ACF0H5_011779 [Mactra antiquata]
MFYTCSRVRSTHQETRTKNKSDRLNFSTFYSFDLRCLDFVVFRDYKKVYNMNKLQILCVLVVASLCLSSINATYIDCSMECLFAAFRQPTVCECKHTRKLHWGKRAPRQRNHKLPIFRYGKRAVPYGSSELDERLDTLRSIQDSFRDLPQYEYDV